MRVLLQSHDFGFIKCKSSLLKGNTFNFKGESLSIQGVNSPLNNAKKYIFRFCKMFVKSSALIN